MNRGSRDPNAEGESMTRGRGVGGLSNLPFYLNANHGFVVPRTFFEVA